MGKRKHSQEEVEQVFLNRGLFLLDTYKCRDSNMHCADEDGYQYLTRYDSITQGKLPLKFSTHNPYTIDNINRYFILNNCKTILVENKYLGSSTQMHFRCECGNIFETTLASVFRGKYYCDSCVKAQHKINHKDFMSGIKELFKEKNYTLVSDHIDTNHEEFKYICNKHKDKGIQKSTYNRMMNHRSFCPYCAIDAKSGHRTRTDDRIKELVESKGFIYVDNYYGKPGKSDNLMVGYICPNHMNKGVQYKTYTNFTKSKGKCKYCMGHGRTKEELQEILDKMHGTITVIEYKDFSTPVMVECNQCGYVWSTSCNNLINGYRCPKRHKSYFSILISKYLNGWGYDHSIEYSFTDCRDVLPLPFDFYLRDFNILIEADGEGHYLPIQFGNMNEEEAQANLNKTQLHDKIKTEYCNKNNIPLIRIPYWERDNLEYFLWDELVKVGAIEKIAI